MKKVILLTLFACIAGMFYSCSSDTIDLQTPDPKEKSYDVTFNVDEFQMETNPLKSAGAKYVAYRVYIKSGSNSEYPDFNYSEVITEKRLNPTEFSGKISLKLPKGEYRITVFLSNSPIGVYADTQYITGGSRIQYGSTGIMYEDLTQEIFRGEVDFAVGEQSITQTLTVKRPISRINLAITDLSRIPPSVKTVIPVIYNKYGEYLSTVVPLHIFLNGKSQFCGGSIDGISPYKKTAISRTNISSYGKDHPISFYFPNNQNPRFIEGTSPGQQDLYLIGLDDTAVTAPNLIFGNPKIVYFKLLKKNIQLLPNQSITISGNIFAPQGLSVSINKEWVETTNNQF